MLNTYACLYRNEQLNHSGSMTFQYLDKVNSLLDMLLVQNSIRSYEPALYFRFLRKMYIKRLFFVDLSLKFLCQ